MLGIGVEWGVRGLQRHILSLILEVSIPTKREYRERKAEKIEEDKFQYKDGKGVRGQSPLENFKVIHSSDLRKTSP